MGEFYGLREIPFEPTGTGGSKYGYVPPENFSIVETALEEVVNEKKLYVLLVKSPQGGGKSSMVEELEKRAEQGKYAEQNTVIVNRLINLDLKTYVNEFLRIIQNKTSIETQSTESKDDAELRNIVVDILTKLGRTNNLVLWVIDEFDILGDFPEDQNRLFLQFIREIIDSLSKETLPVAFIMSHTMKSSQEFQRHLERMHGPFASRVKPIEIGYSLEDIRKIAALRLGSVSGRAFGEINPFSEESLRILYDFIVAADGTEKLSNFRLFEQCCYYALQEGGKREIATITPDVMQRIFVENYKEIEKEDELSLGVKVARRSKLKSSMTKNEAILQGLVEGIKEMSNFKILSVPDTAYCGVVNHVHVSCMNAKLNYRDKKDVVTAWFIASKEEGIMGDEDAISINELISEWLRNVGKYSHVKLLSYVSDISMAELKFDGIDKIVEVSKKAANDLVGLSCDEKNENDKDRLMDGFNREIRPKLEEIFVKEVRDVTKVLSPQARRLIETLFLGHYSGKHLTKSSLRDDEKILFDEKSKKPEKFVTEIIDLGFASEEGYGVIPTIPKALCEFMDTIVSKETDIKAFEKFGDLQHVLTETSESLGLIKREISEIIRNYPSEIESEIKEDVETVSNALSDEKVKRTKAGIKAQELINALENVSGEDEITKVIVNNAAKKLLPSIIAEIKTIQKKMPEVVLRKTETISRKLELEEQLGEGEHEEQKAITTVAAPSEPEPTITEYKPTIEDAIISIVNENPLTFRELTEELSSKGYSTDVRSIIIKLLISNRIKIAA